jgi:hypothetical protein
MAPSRTQNAWPPFLPQPGIRGESRVHSTQSLGPATPVGPSFLANDYGSPSTKVAQHIAYSREAAGLRSGEAKREHHSTAGVLLGRNTSVMRPHSLGHDCKTKSGAD